MDAFDNPAKGGMGSLQHDGLPTDQVNRVAASGDLLAGTAAVTAAAAAIPLAIQGILVPDASGRIVLPAGVSLDDITVSGSDLVIALPNGQVLIIPNGAVNIPTIVVDGNVVPASTVAQLLEGLDDLNPEAGLRSSGGNFADPEGDIQDAYALGDLLPYTELAFPVPEDEEQIPDVPDEEPTTIIVTPDQPAGSVNATASVNEAGLPARGSEPAGSNSAATSEITSGSILFDTPDGFGSMTLNGVAITAVGQVFTTPFGQLVITSIAPGNIGYTYTLTDNSNAGTNPMDIFAVVVTDRDGDVATANLTIAIVDDVPTARADTDAVAPATFTAETGNVISGTGTTSGAAGADTQGADGATLNGITAGTGTTFAAPGSVIQGQYGTLTIDAQGNYSYVRGANTPGGVTDVFTYRLTDGDGDTSTATLTISIGDSPSVITFIPVEGAGTIVNEAELPPRSAETPGSSFDGDNETTTGTITFTSRDGVASVTINGVAVTPGALPQQIFSDATGTLVITGYTYNPVTGLGSITYSYTLKDNTLNGTGTTVSFDVVVTDLDGDVADGDLNIRIIDDVPTAVNDADSATEDGPLTADGNVLTGVGGGDANATDGVADTPGADGATVTAVTGGTVGTAFATAYGTLTLNADGSYTYVLNNAAQPVQGLSAGETLTEVFTYTITDGDGDTATATLTITINGADDGVTITGLDVNGGELVVDEDNLPDGSSPDAGALTQPGSFSIATPDGLGNVTIGGTQVVTNGVFTAGTATSPLGTINITGFTPVLGADGSVIGGTFTYEYVLVNNTLTHGAPGEDNVTDSFAVTVTDSDGSVGNASLDVVIVDDVPAALPDSDSVTEDSGNGDNPPTADGNVLTGLGGGDANATDGVADTQGADGAVVTAVTGGTVGTAFTTAYGTLTLNADGSYSYVLNNAAQPVQGLSAGQTLTETFTYTITDGDGDTATATLTITINGADDGVTINGLDGAGAELLFDEDDLPARAGEPAGSDPAKEAITDGGSFSVATPDGMGSVVLDSFNGAPIGPLTLVTANGTFTPQSVATAYGTLSITGFTPVLGADGSVIGGTFTYSYTLTDNRTDHGVLGEDNLSDSIGVTVTDSDGSSASANIDITVTDDVPTAAEDFQAQPVENQPVTINVLANDTQGADGVQPSTVQFVDGSLTGAGTLVNNGDGTFTYTQAPGEIGEVSFQYEITDGDGDTSIATATIMLVADSMPQIRNADDATVDEDGLPGANIDNGLPGEVSSTGSTTATGTIVIDFGGDVPASLTGSLVLNDSAALDTQLTVDGVAVTFAKDGADLVGSVGGVEVIRITLTTATAGPGATEVTFGYSVTLSASIDQIVPGSEDTDILAAIGFTVTDNDGSTASGSFGITIVDDIPTLSVSDTPTNATEGGPAVAGSWSLDAGADGVDSVTVTFGASNAILQLTPGSSVTIVQPTGTLTVNADGTFTFLATGDQNNGLNPAATFTLSAVDRDDDPTSDTLTIAIDDGANPVGGDTLTLTVNEAAIDGIGRTPASNAEIASGTLDFTAGSDTLSGFVFDGVAGLVANLDGVGTDIFWTLSPDGKTIVGSLTNGGPAAITIGLTAPASVAPGVTSTVTVTVTLADNLPHALAMAAQTQALGTVTVKSTDTDGDIATGVVTIEVVDDIPTATAEGLRTLAEGTTVSGAFDFVPGADGAGLTAINGNAVTFNLDGWSNWIDLGSGELRVTANGLYEFKADATTLSPVPEITGTFTVTDGDNDTATAGFSFQINDANTPTGGSAAATVDDDGLFGGNPASGPDNGPATFSATLGGAVGLDGAGANGFTFAGNTTGTVGLETVSYAVVGNVLTATITSGARAGTALFKVEITNKATGDYTVTLLDNVLHAGGPNGENLTDPTAAISYTITDADGSPVPGNILTISFDDDAPTATAEGLRTLAEGTTVSGAFDFVPGADGAGLTAINGNAVTFNLDGWSNWIDLGSGELRVTANGLYEFKADATTLSPVPEITGTFTVTDGDNDTATAGFSFQINDANTPTGGSAAATVDDDGLFGGNPASGPDNGPATFSATLGGAVGLDGAGANGFTFAGNTTGTVGLETVSYAVVGNVLTATITSGARAGTALFKVEITNKATGDYTVTLLDNVLHAGGPNGENLTDPTAAISYTITDADGSPVPGNILTISFDDDAPTATAEGLRTLAEGTTVSGAFDFVPGADGAGLTAINGNAVTFNLDGWSNWIDLGSGELRVTANGLYEFKADATTLSPVPEITGTFTVTDGDNDTATAGFSFQINDANTPTGGSAAATVDDDGLFGGNPASGPDNGPATFSATLGGAVGLDGAGANGFTFAGNTTGTVGLETVSYAVVGNVLTATITSGARAGTALFKVEITNKATGDYTVTLLDNVLHAGGPNGENLTDPTAAISYTITDADGSPVPGNILTISFDDDAPVLAPTNGPEMLTLLNQVGSASGSFAANFGADGASGYNITGPTIDGITYTETDISDGMGNFVRTELLGETSDGTDIFKLTVNADGSYKFDLITPDAATEESISFANLGAGGPGFRELADDPNTPLNEAGRVEFQSNGSGVNASTPGFGVSNQWTDSGEWFELEFHEPGNFGVNDAPQTNADLLDAVTLRVQQVGSGPVDFQWTATRYNPDGSVAETQTGMVTVTSAGLLVIDPTIQFSVLRLDNIDSDSGARVRFATDITVSRTVLPPDQTYNFNVVGTDGDGDVSNPIQISVFVDEPSVPPLVLDLDGDGVEFVSQAAGVSFDYFGDGTSYNTAWVGSDDGLLAFDANGNGKVDNGTEIVFGGNGLTDLEGLAAQYDSNGDGLLTSADADFASFGVWQDINTNGVSDAGEFRSLEQAGIVSIKLTSDGKSYDAANGDVHVYGETSYQMADGTVLAAADAAFATNGTKAALIGSVRTQDRPATAMPITDALVAASLVAIVGGSGHIARVQPEAFATLDPAAGPQSQPATATISGSTPPSLGLGDDTPSPTAGSTTGDGSATVATGDAASSTLPADADEDSWQSASDTQTDATESTSLFDLVADSGPDGSGLMDGLLLLAVQPASQPAEAAIAANDPAADAVLAEVVGSDGVDLLLNAIAGGAPEQVAIGDAPTFDLASFLKVQVTPDVAFPTSQPLEQDLHQLTAA